jgi:SPP1 family predicted phage head-tail adaptor
MTVVFDTGKAKHPITIQQKVKVSDGAGSNVEKWTGWGVDRARVLPISAAERIRGNQKELSTTHLIEIRYRPGVKSSMRIVNSSSVEGERSFEIISIINVEEESVKLQLLCRELT